VKIYNKIFDRGDVQRLYRDLPTPSPSHLPSKIPSYVPTNPSETPTNDPSEIPTNDPTESQGYDRDKNLLDEPFYLAIAIIGGIITVVLCVLVIISGNRECKKTKVEERNNRNNQEPGNDNQQIQMLQPDVLLQGNIDNIEQEGYEQNPLNRQEGEMEE